MARYQHQVSRAGGSEGRRFRVRGGIENEDIRANAARFGHDLLEATWLDRGDGRELAGARIVPLGGARLWVEVEDENVAPVLPEGGCEVQRDGGLPTPLSG